MRRDHDTPTTVVYRSATSETLGPEWDVIHVIYKQQERTTSSVVVARDASGAILHKTDILLDRWEEVTNQEALRSCREWFNNRDRLAAEETAGAGRKVET